MEPIIVTVKLEGEAQIRDIEVQPDINAEMLASIIAAGFGWDVGVNGEKIEYQIEVTPPGKILKPDQTLAQVGAWDGAWLVLKRVAGQNRFANPSARRLNTSTDADEFPEEVDPAPAPKAGSTGPSSPPTDSPLSSRKQGYSPRRIDGDD